MYLNMAGPVRYNGFGQSGSATVHLDINYTRCWLHTVNDHGYDIILLRSYELSPQSWVWGLILACFAKMFGMHVMYFAMY